MMREQVRRVLAGTDTRGLTRRQRTALVLPLLQRIQRELGHLPREAFTELSGLLGVPESRIFGVATFYSHFRLSPPGQNQITVCCGTACHVRGSAALLEELRRRLGIATGETSPDGRFSLERIACFGSCAIAPVVLVNGRVHGRMTRARLMKTVDRLAADGEAGANEKEDDQ